MQKLTQYLKVAITSTQYLRNLILSGGKKKHSNRLSFSRNHCRCKNWILYRNHNIFHKSFLSYWNQIIHISPLCTCSIQPTVSFCASNWGTLFNFSRSVNTLTAFKAELPIPLQRTEKQKSMGFRGKKPFNILMYLQPQIHLKILLIM